ncbi:MAG: HAMP domain-containing histidine kinase [Candidatus Thermoplasmatota archaeon]|nr:HAMP domain-containing histidine kinase [Candidatus Thermoplasmatota archaeon]
MRGIINGDESAIEPREGLAGVPISEMLEILELICRVEPLDALLERVASMISKRFGIKALTICVQDEETGFFRPQTVQGFPEDQKRAIRNHAYPLDRKRDELDEKFRIDNNCYYVRAEGLTQVYNDDVDYISDIAELSKTRDSSDEWHDLDYIDFIMTDRLGNWIGWIEIDEPENRKMPSRETIAKIQVLSGLTAIAVENSKMYQDAIDAVGESQSYLNLIVHDIGNLVDPLIFYLESMERAKHTSEDYTTQLAKAISLARDAKNLVENVRGISSIKASDELPGRRYDLREVLIRCISSVKRDHPSRDVVVGFDCPYTECFVKADELIFDLFSNILGNSVKYSGGTTAEFDVSIADGHSAWTVRVEDRGIGIPDDKKESVFSKFARRPDGCSGSGLGLSVVSLLVDRYKGIVTVKDRVPEDYEKGACFEVALPKDQGDRPRKT